MDTSQLGRDDLALLHAWREGDQGAGEELFERHYDSVARFFANKVTRGVDDLIQNTFLGCLESRDRFREDSSFRTFLFSIAKNLLYTHYRNKRRDGARFDFATHSAADIAPGAGSLMVQREEEQLFLFALRNIPIEHQILLEMYYWESQRAVDIAQWLDIPEGTVRTRLRRAKELLQKAMTDLASSSELLERTSSGVEDWVRSIRAKRVSGTPSG